MLIKLLLIFICIFLYKLLSNISNYFRCNSLKKGYFNWIESKNVNYPSYKREVLNLFKNANVTDAFFPTAQPLGYMQISTFNASVQANFPSLLVNHASATIGMFDESIGTYRLRIKECFNPFYWLELVVFFPKNLLIYINLDSEKAAFKILNVLFTGIWWIIITCFTSFSSQFKYLIIKLTEHIS